MSYYRKSNKKILVPILIVLSVFLLATTMQANFATTRTVDITTARRGITGGLNSSADGDTILLNEGTYTGSNNTNLTINKNVTIQGNGPEKK
ncbi:hypothetical protein ALNOE001_03840 [Candidatus Methanobinarius endosymbioticus]|uniref:Uncharacterized protein n=1 Tax=Candidatus Methanobinarius endosymbioticus TaxID=2006182 RepID=A0A366MFI3_9EURY|nr:hypothetical protein ALNOE001_03840 [Candidatus Methanobinarius endosymbioticus]